MLITVSPLVFPNRAPTLIMIIIIISTVLWLTNYLLLALNITHAARVEANSTPDVPVLFGVFLSLFGGLLANADSIRVSDVSRPSNESKRE